jgi:hypothetical protein
LSRTDQLRWLFIDVLNNEFRLDPRFPTVKIPLYTEAHSQNLPTHLAVNVLSFNDEPNSFNDLAGVLKSNFTFYRREDSPTTSIADFRVLPSLANATYDELTPTVFQLDFLPPRVAEHVEPGKPSPYLLVLSRLDYVFATLTDSQATYWDVPEATVVPTSFLIYQGTYVFKRDVHWTYDKDTRRITFLASPTDGSERLTPRVDPEVNIVYLVKGGESQEHEVLSGETYDHLIPHTRLTLAAVTPGEVVNIRRSREKDVAYDVYQGWGSYVMTLQGQAVTKKDGELLQNFVLLRLRELRVRLAHYGMSVSDIQGSFTTEGEEVDASADITKGFELTWNVRCQYQFLKPRPHNLFNVCQLVFETELDPGYRPLPQTLEYFTMVETFN